MEQLSYYAQFGNLSEIALAVIAVIALWFSWKQISSDRKRQQTETLTKYFARFHINYDLRIVTKYLESCNRWEHHSRVKTPDDHQILAFVRYFAEIELLIESNVIEPTHVCKVFAQYISYFEKEKEKGKWPNIKKMGYCQELYQHFADRIKNNQKK
ncbi:MAG: hypothetical protein Q4E32_03440 [Bacteroidales bacterium]|nr:hypothetical protein [Bacteroidales bacterium]